MKKIKYEIPSLDKNIKGLMLVEVDENIKEKDMNLELNYEISLFIKIDEEIIESEIDVDESGNTRSSLLADIEKASLDFERWDKETNILQYLAYSNFEDVIEDEEIED